MRISIFASLILLLFAACKDMAVDSDTVCAAARDGQPYFTEQQVSPDMDDTLRDIVLCIDDEAKAAERADNIGAGAPEEMRDLLIAIYRDLRPDPVVLADMEPAELDRTLEPRDDNYNHTTLVTEAVRRKNYRWTRAILEAGADPNARGSLMAYTASFEQIFDPRSNVFQLYQDGRPTIPFLQLYVDHGGDVNTAEGGMTSGAPLVTAHFNNIAAMVFLLEHGADPWKTGEDDVRELWYDSSLFGKYLGSWASDYNEMMYTFIIEGQFRLPDVPLYRKMMYDETLRSLEKFSDATGPEDRHTLWTLQRVLNALIERTDFDPPARMVELLAQNPVPDSEGGWVTPANQYFQNYDDERRGAVHGTEIW